MWSLFLVVLLLAGALTPFALYYLDPDRPLHDIEAQLDRGLPVTLIGETGRPAWSRWQVGGEKAQTSLAPDGAFSIHTWERSLLELVPDPRQSGFRLRGEVRHESSNRAADVGLYVCHSSPADGLHEFIGLSFDDIIDELEQWKIVRATKLDVPLPPPPEGNPVNFFAMHYAKKEDGEEWFNSWSMEDPPQRFKVDRGVWRSLTIEVTKSEVRGFWTDKRLLAGRLIPHQLTVQAEQSLKQFRLRQPEARPMRRSNAYFSARGGVGLYLVRGSASFRRVTIEPLPEGAGGAGNNP